MSGRRRWLWRAATALALVAVAAAMFVVGRGHTVYFDNKTLEYAGATYPAVYKIVVNAGTEKPATLLKRERGMATWMGQNFRMTLAVTEVKGGETVTHTYALKLPYGMDGIVLNLPGLLAGLAPEAYRSSFVPLVDDARQEEEVLTQEELLPGDI